MRALTRVAVPRNEAELLQLAGVLTASQLERALRSYRRVTTAEACELHDREQLDYYWDEDGSLVVRGRLAPEDGALFLAALEAARERLRQADEERRRGSAEPLRRPTNVEALVAVADAALAQETNRSSGDRYQVVVHIDQTALAGDSDGSCVLADGPALAPETARRIACDAGVVTLDMRAAIPLNIGRKTRTIPPSLRRALAARDRGCRFPGCDRCRFVDAHHIRHWASCGETALDNVLLLCRHHHRLLHEGGYTVERQHRFFDRHGHRIRPAPTQPRGTMAELRVANRNLDLTPATCAGGHGDRMDLDLAVEALLGMIGRPDRSQAA